MALIDDQVKGWLKEKFLRSADYMPATHGEAEGIEVISVDAGWDCGCYSEYTRDDSFGMTAKLKTPSGNVVSYSYGYWGDMPSFIQEMDEFINGNECPYDEDYED